MPEPTPLHVDRHLALSFGAQAQAYEDHRPDFPDDLMDAVAALGHRVLDVGSGTGKAAAALLARGCDVLAVEPDSDMADIARAKGVTVEPGTFEHWDPRGRSFDLVVFARSWHWVDPIPALAKLAEILPVGGHVALLSHESSWRGFDNPAIHDIVDGVLGNNDTARRRLTDETAADFTAAGFDMRVEDFPLTETVTVADWLDTVFTYSRFLVLDQPTKYRLRDELSAALGDDPITITGSPRAMIARRR
ncbi:class I SAM-dependent methyltransferase [Williamsia maris]|uniref:Methyltransferase domain-containing protein n=1 Tax=Williamsia maris TaxID=72806 RepID=A0ABT1HEJ9_9NOCA|nr:class I SAM-dependent methyltransferase [Williamsia maris]MCP2176677.1 Methyltransferase domain-containing protein [Williamsia maris]